MIVFKLIGAFVLYLFLPLTALTYYFSRRPRREAEVNRILSILTIDYTYSHAYETEKLSYYLWAVAYASVVFCVGLTLLFFSNEIGVLELPQVQLGNVEVLQQGSTEVPQQRSVGFPQKGSRLMLAMAFLGAYLWGLQHVFRRYALNDLTPSVYYDLSMRMILAAITALVIYNAYAALAGDAPAQGGITANIWPSLAFLIGMFPQRGLRWLTDRLPMLSPAKNFSVQEAPLEMIEGMESHDILRLAELGIDSCYDLATADFVPLTLKTPYSARQLIDCILQAKACVYFGESVKDLRRHGIRTIIDLEPLTPLDIEGLAKETSVTKYALQRAQQSVKTDPEIARLREVGQLLGKFWERRDNKSTQPQEITVSSTEKI